MDSFYSSPNGESEPSAEAGHVQCFLESPAAYADVMREQMEYLLHHLGASCFPGCPDCARLEQVKRPLLRPFC